MKFNLQIRLFFSIVSFGKIFFQHKFRFKFLLISKIFFALLFSTAQASDQDIINQQDWMIRQQQNIIDDQKRINQFENILKDYQFKEKERKKNEQPNLISSELSKCVLIKEVELLDAKLISKYRQKKILANFIGKCIEANTVENLIKVIGDYYKDKGFVTTQILMPKQNILNGIIKIQVIEGKINKIVFNNNKIIDRMQSFTAFGNIEGKILNVKDLDQGISQINRLQSNSAIIKIEPALDNGGSVVKIENNRKFPAKLTIGRDNLGNDFTGINRSNFSLNLDNLLFLNDNINLNYTTNLDDNNKTKDMQSFAVMFSMPFRYNIFSYDYTYSNFKGRAGNNFSSGFSQSSKVATERVLLNLNKLKLLSNISLVNKYSVSFVDGRKSAPSERVLSILNIGLIASNYFNNNLSVYINPSYAKGLRILNANKDNPNQINTEPRAEFEALKIYANIGKRLIIPKIKVPINFSTDISGQYSKQTLYGSEQFSVGGYNSVRGFRENYINGDNGYYFRNKLNVNLGSFGSSFINDNNQKKSNFLIKGIEYLNKIALEPFYDYGYAKKNFSDEGADGRLSGAGVKLIFNNNYINASIAYSSALSSSKLITSRKENKMIYFEVFLTH